jgi:prolyl-tRNA editing enzyme YbaK/EbsC (Cys-tRNA(Pro) deacylase)
MSAPLKPSARRVQDALAERGFSNQVIELVDSTRTAAEAAAAVGCQVAQIAKSLLFRSSDGTPVLVVAAGNNRVNVKALEARIGHLLERPDADFVREQTGFVIGGVPPVGHLHPLEIWIDADLWTHAEIWAAAGHPNAVFRLTPDELLAMTGGRVVQVT